MDITLTPGVFSLIVIGVIGMHVFFDFVMPNNSQSYYLAKDFITTFCLFFIIPVCTYTCICFLSCNILDNFLAFHVKKRKSLGCFIIRNLYYI
jgi:hypothetical protein